MNENILYETLNKLSDNQRKLPMYIYQDETGEIKEEPLKLDMAASTLINRTMKQHRNPAKELRDLMFH